VWICIPNPGIAFPLLAFLTFCAALRGNVVKRLFSNSWITTVGGMCNTIYLLYYPLVSALGKSPIGMGSGCRSPGTC